MSDRTQRSHQGIGNGMSTRGRQLQHGKSLTVEARDLQPDVREGQAGPSGVADKLRSRRTTRFPGARLHDEFGLIRLSGRPRSFMRENRPSGSMSGE